MFLGTCKVWRKEIYLPYVTRAIDLVYYSDYYWFICETQKYLFNSNKTTVVFNIKIKSNYITRYISCYVCKNNKYRTCKQNKY